MVSVLWKMGDPQERSRDRGEFRTAGFPAIGDVLFALKPQYMANPFVYPEP